MDSLDHQLLSLLRVDARASVALLAKKLGISRGTVNNRIDRMMRGGVLVGFTVKLRPDAQPHEIRAWVSVAVQGDRTPEVVRALLGDPAVTSLHDTNGQWDLLAEVRATSNEELSKVLDRIRKIKGIVNTETSIHLATFARSG